MTERESQDEGCVHSFRNIIRQLVHIFDHAHSEAQAKLRLHQLRQDIHAMEDRQLHKIPPFFDDHWDQALRYLRKKGMGTHRRGANSESGMRLLRRLEKHHDGIRSAATRQHDMQIYQAMKYLSFDVADFIEKGLQLAELPDVYKVGHTRSKSRSSRGARRAVGVPWHTAGMAFWRAALAW